MPLRREDLRSLVDLGDRLTVVETADGLSPVVLRSLAEVVGADAALWHRVDTAGPVREVVVGWPPERFTLDLARRTAPVLASHPMLELYAGWRAAGHRLPALGRMSEYVSRRQWRASALYRDALSDVDDQMLLVTRAQGPVLEYLSVERRGRSFGRHEQELVAAGARQLRAALRRTQREPYPVLQTSPVPLWTQLDPRTVRPGPPDLLSNRQREVLALVAEGMTDAQVARRLGITTRTVSKHLQRTYAALGVSGRVAALAAADASTLPGAGRGRP